MRKKTPVIFLSLLLICNFTSLSFAAFNLAVDPLEGGYDLRFGRVDINSDKVVKELTIRVTTDIGKQYRVYQRIDQPLRTPDGVEIEKNQLKMYNLVNSNTKGTLECLEELPVMYADTLLYTSNPSGEGDSFRIVYTLSPAIEQVAGDYYGRMQFVLIPIDSTQEQVIETINVYAQLSGEGVVEVTTSTGFKDMRISSKDIGQGKADYPVVYIKVKGNMGSRYKIYGSLDDNLLKSDTADMFDLTRILYNITSGNSSQVVKEGKMADFKSKILLYTSDGSGMGDEIAVKYMPAEDFIWNNPGFYRGQINYYLEKDSALNALDLAPLEIITLECEVEPIFRIVTFAVKKGDLLSQDENPLQFGVVGYKDGVKENKVRIKVESNMHKPYMVTQKVDGGFENEKGEKISSDSFTLSLSKTALTLGKLGFEGESAFVPDKDTTLFISDNTGESDEFEVTYKLKITGDTRGGNYNAGISYSLSEL